MSVNWVLDGNGNYEISSVEHLLQLMNEGGLFTDTGTAPTSYLTSSYIQTVDVDLAANAASIVPIGFLSTANFTGDYDGQGYSISNWSYTNPTATTSIGLFRFLNTGALLKNMVLDGVWVLTDGNTSGFLAGSTNNSCLVYNITTNFSSGTRLVSSGTTGVIVGSSASSAFSNITVGGIIDECVGGGSTGGIVGNASGTAPHAWSHLRNIAIFQTGLQTLSNRAGGIAGNFEHECSHVMNAMNGDIVGGTTSEVGGVFGRSRANFEDVVVSMRGNITTAVGQTAAGVAGRVESGTFTRVLNYMTGDVECGLFANVGSATLEKCVVAMRGTTTYAAIIATTGPTEVLLDTSYDIVASFTNDTVSTMDVSSFDDVNADGLPFFSFAYTDPVGNLVDWEFLFGNFSLFQLTPHPLSIDVDFFVVLGVVAVAYMLTIQETGGSVVTVAQGFTDFSKRAINLKPETEYTLRLLSTSGTSVYTQLYEDTTTTLENVAANHDISSFENEDGVYDISVNNTSTVGFLSSVMDEIFTTGDELIVSVPDNDQTRCKFVNRGDSYSIVDQDSLIVPFNANAGASQSISMILSDTSSVPVLYDNGNDTVTIGGTVYSSGDSTIVDDKKLTVINI